MKILCYGDIHFRLYGSSKEMNSIQDNGLSLELNNIVEGYRWIEDTLKKEKPDLLIFLGDLFDSPDRIDVKTLYACDQSLSSLHKVVQYLGIDHVALLGNHDLNSYNSYGNINSLSIVKKYFSKVITDSVVTEDYNGYGIKYIPYMEPKDFSEELKKDREILIIAHTDVYGSKMDSGKLSDCPIDTTGIRRMISGHLHVKQNVGQTYYPGSLINNRFNRNCSPEDFGGALLYDTDEDSIVNLYNDRSRHYLVIKDLSDLDNLNHKNFVYKIIGEYENEYVRSVMDKCEDSIYSFSKVFTEEIKKEYLTNEETKTMTPKEILLEYVDVNIPELSETAKEILI